MTVAKGIMLLSAGEPSDTVTEIKRTIADGKLRAGKVTILAFGIDSGMLSWSVEVALATCKQQK